MRHVFLLCGFIFLGLGCALNPTIEDRALTNPKDAGSYKTNSDEALGLFKDGFRYYQRGEFLKAIQHMEASLILDPRPEDPWTHYLLYYCYLSTGRYDESLIVAKRILIDHPYDPVSYLQIGLARMGQGRPRQALKSFRRSFEFDSYQTKSRFYAGLAHHQLNEIKERNRHFREAQKQYQEALKRNPRDFLANYELASMYLFWNYNLALVPQLLKSAKLALAEEPEEELLKIKHLYEEFYLPLIEGIYLSQQRLEPRASNRWLFQALKNAPNGIQADLAEVYYYLGRNYLVLDDRPRAQAFLEKAAATEPHGVYQREIARLRRSLQ